MNEARDDGYVPFDLPPPGSEATPSPEQLNRICDEWYIAERHFVSSLLRKTAGNSGDDLERATSATALAFFVAVRQGNLLADVIRRHLSGEEPIRVPKAMFIETIELCRYAPVRQSQRERKIQSHEHGVDAVDLERLAKPPVADAAGRTDDVRVTSLLAAREALVAMAGEAPSSDQSAARLARLLDRLEAWSAEAVRTCKVLVALTERQRFVFLQRVDPLSVVEGLALDYELLVRLSEIAGRRATTESLRQSTSQAVARARLLLASVKGDLEHG